MVGFGATVVSTLNKGSRPAQISPSCSLAAGVKMVVSVGRWEHSSDVELSQIGLTSGT